jgi:D-xylose transport system ATP-binding protein
MAHAINRLVVLPCARPCVHPARNATKRGELTGMPDPAPILKVDNIKKNFGSVEALKGVNFEVFPGEVVALLGDNGAGKSTLVKIIAGNQQPSSGTLWFEGRKVSFETPGESKKCGIETVYQDLSLCSKIDVVGNFFMGRELCRKILGVKVLDEKAMQAAAEKALGDIGTRIPSVRTNVEFLSGGQRQAIELSRFVHWGGKLVMLDEPFAALGVEQTRRGLLMIEKIKDMGIAVIVITHNMLHAFQVADRVVVLRHGVVAGDHETRSTSPEEVVGMITGDFEMARRAAR